MSKTRNRFSIVTTTILLATTLTATGTENPLSVAGEVNHQEYESAGVLGGVVAGALLAGPIGAVTAAAFGGWVGNQAASGRENVLLTQALTEQRSELLALQAEYRSLEARYQTASRETEAARVRQASFSSKPAIAACCSDSEMSLHFKTNSADLETLYDAKLKTFAELVRTFPDAVISVTGHADRRGESGSNLALSQRRVDAVKNRLKGLGVTNAFVQSSAFGESMPQSDADSLENNFFDRRVVVKVIASGNSYLTHTND
jgi:sortase system peptidoglycan-associated protein